MINITVNGTPYSVPSSASDTSWASSQIAFEQALASAVNLALNPNPLTWTSISSYGSGWSGNVEYTKTAVGRVLWRGRATHAGSVLSNAFPLPVGYTPPQNAYFACIDANASGLCAVVFTSTGPAQATILSGANGSNIDFGPVQYDTQAF